MVICVKCYFKSTKSSNDKEFCQLYPALQQYIVSYSRSVTEHVVALTHSSANTTPRANATCITRRGVVTQHAVALKQFHITRKTTRYRANTNNNTLVLHCHTTRRYANAPSLNSPSRCHTTRQRLNIETVTVRRRVT